MASAEGQPLGMWFLRVSGISTSTGDYTDEWGGRRIGGGITEKPYQGLKEEVVVVCLRGVVERRSEISLPGRHHCDVYRRLVHEIGTCQSSPHINIHIRRPQRLGYVLG